MKGLLLAVMLPVMLASSAVSSSVSSDSYVPYDYSSSDVVEDLSCGDDFRESDYPVDLSDRSLSLLNLFESGLGDLYFYVYSPKGLTMAPDNFDFYITLSEFPSSYTAGGYTKYQLAFNDSNLSGTLLKFRLKYATRYSSYSYVRSYCCGEISCNPKGSSASFVSSPASKEFTYTGEPERQTLSYTVEDISHLDLDCTYGVKRVYQSKSFEYLGFFSQKEAIDVNYLTVPIDDSYGELIGARMTWSAQQIKVYDYTVFNGWPGISNHYDVLNDVGQKTYDISSDDTHDLRNADNPTWWSWLSVLTWEYYFTVQGKADFKDVAGIEKLSYPFTDNSYLLSDDSIRSLQSDSDHLNDQYVIRYAFNDAYESKVGTETDTTEWKLSGVDVLSCTFSKEGRVYVIPVVGKSFDPDPVTPIDPGDANAFWTSFVSWFMSNLPGSLFICMLVIIVLPTLIALCPGILGFLAKIFKYILLGLWWVIKAPFLLLKKIFGK